MATGFPTTQLYADEFLESCGAITFNAKHEICLLYNPLTKEYTLPKGRRNTNEPRSSAALREFSEETGFACTIQPVRMSTRAPPEPEDPTYKSDHAVVREKLVDPFALQIREEGRGWKKLVWWYVAHEAVDAKGEGLRLEEDLGRMALWVGVLRAVEVLTFENDRELVQRAYEIYQDNKS